MKRRFRSSPGKNVVWRTTLGLLLAGGCVLNAQVSTSAYRVLGQPNLSQYSVNIVQGVELNSPSGLALDTRSGQTHLYISDTSNSRVLAWQDAGSYQSGDPPTLVLGQPGPQYSRPLGIGAKGFNGPVGLAVDPRNGNLYVADISNNRVLRFPSPFANPTRIEPDAVYGQASFTSQSTAASRSSLKQPRAVAFDSSGNLWVADSGNHRVLRFNSAVLDAPTPPDADLVLGQTDFLGGSPNRGGGGVSASGFDLPTGLAFDSQDNLYVSDFNNTRVLRFSAPVSGASAAITVWGEADFSTRGVPLQPSSSTLAGPVGLSPDGNGNLYVAVPNDNRVMIFQLNAPIVGGAKNVLGQSDFSSNTANANVSPLASPSSLAFPTDVKVDASGNVYVADAANNRVLSFTGGSKSANRVWGQSDFTCNGVNQVKPNSLNFPYKVAIDYSREPFALYVSDAYNNRVLVWKDSVRFRNGDPADLVIGQPDLRTGVANVDTRGSAAPSRTSLSAPSGLAVNPYDGSLYVADSGNNRVLRYPRPVSQGGRITPDAVIGQVDFNSSTSAAVGAWSLRAPGSVALGPNGNLFVADSGNHRVLEFSAGSGNGASAIRVYGQPNMTSSSKPTQFSAQTLAAPQGVFVDGSSNLYVADTGANRVLIFPNTQSSPPAGMAAAFVLGQTSFRSATAGSSTFKAPSDVGVDSNGGIYVADFGNNRVLAFPSLVFLPAAGATATGVVGQKDANGTAANWNTPDGRATPEGLSGPVSLYLDRQDTLYVSDAGNSRVLHFLKATSVVNAATFQAGVPVAQGGLATLWGAGLAQTPRTAPGLPWPDALDTREVVVNDEIRAPLQYMGRIQVNFQVPSSAPIGSQRVAVRLADTGELLAGGSLLVAGTAPGLFTLNAAGQAAAVNQDNTINGTSNPAPKGSVILLYGTGQGQVSPAVADATAAPSSPLSVTVAVTTSDGKACLNSQPSMCVAIGNSFGEIQYSGLAPGFVGLWQINVKIPPDAPVGNAVPVRVVLNGTPSNVVTVAIR